MPSHVSVLLIKSVYIATVKVRITKEPHKRLIIWQLVVFNFSTSAEYISDARRTVMGAFGQLR